MKSLLGLVFVALLAFGIVGCTSSSENMQKSEMKKSDYKKEHCMMKKEMKSGSCGAGKCGKM